MANRYIIGKIADNNSFSNSIVILNEYWVKNIQLLCKEKPIAVLSDYKYAFSHISSYFQRCNIPIFFVSKNQLKNLVSSSLISIDILTQNIIVGKVDQLKLKLNSAKNEKEIKIYSSIKGDDLSTSILYDSDGIGLVSTEFIFWGYTDMSSAIQYSVLDEMFSKYPNKEYTIRLFDITEDKKPLWFIQKKSNVLNLNRGIKLLLEPQNIEKLKNQIQAIVKLSEKYKISILIPYINDIDDIKFINNIINTYIVRNKISVGVMLETTESILKIDQMKEVVDFFSVGSNDLVESYFRINRQYVNNFKDIDFYSDLFIEFLKLIIAKSADKEVRICGQLPIIPNMFEKLVDIGYRHFTVNPYWIPYLKGKIQILKNQYESK